MLLPPGDIVALLSHYVPLSSCHVSKVPQNRRASGPSGVPQENPAQARMVQSPILHARPVTRVALAFVIATGAGLRKLQQNA